MGFSEKLSPATFTRRDHVHECALSRLLKQQTEQVWFGGSAELMQPLQIKNRFVLFSVCLLNERSNVTIM